MVDRTTQTIILAFVVLQVAVAALVFTDLSLVRIATYVAILTSLAIALYFLWSLAEFFKEKGTQYLIKDMEYLNYFPAVSARGTHGTSHYLVVDPDKPRGKAYSRVFAFLAYRSDIINLSKRTYDSKRYPNREANGVIERYKHSYIDTDLRRQVFASIKLEKKLAGKGVVEIRDNAPFALASYVFANLKEGNLVIEEEKLAFFYNKDYAPDAAYKLRDIELSQLEPFDGVPSSWVCYALLGDES